MKNRTRTIGVSLASAMVALSPLAVFADAISPSIKDTGKKYSTEPPKADYYGTGIGGRAMEAMDLRFQVERALQDAEWDIAISKAKKATQLDPADPGTHLLLARAMTKKLYTNKGPVDEKLLRQCLYEWTLLWHHDSDQWDQLEAKNESKRLARIVKVLDEQKLAEQQAREQAKEALAQERFKRRQLAIKEIDEIGGTKKEQDGAATEPVTSKQNKKGSVPAKNAVSPVKDGSSTSNDAAGLKAATASAKTVTATVKQRSVSLTSDAYKQPTAIASKRPLQAPTEKSDETVQEEENTNPSIQAMENHIYARKKKRFGIF